MTYSIMVYGHDPRVPSTDSDDAREEAIELVKRLQKRGHKIDAAQVNGIQFPIPEAKKQEAR